MIIIWLAFLLSGAWAQVCSIGDPEQTHLLDLFNKPELSEDDSLLKAYRAQAALKKLPTIRQTLPESKLNPVCVKLSMDRAPFIAAKRKVCINSNDYEGQTVRVNHVTPPSKFSAYDEVIPQDMCLSNDMVSYVEWSFSQAVSCVNNLPSVVEQEAYLTPLTLFEIFNAESAFGFYLYSKRGIGVGQLTTSGVSDFFPNARYEHLLEEIASSDHPSCLGFQELVKKPIQRNRGGTIQHCQFLSIGEGVGRNILFSVLHLATREFEVIGRLKRRGYHNVDREVIDQLLFISYSRHGLQGAYNIINGGHPLNTMTAADFYKRFSGAYPYLKEVRSRTAAFVKKYNQYHGTNATLDDFFNKSLCQSTASDHAT